VGAAAPTIDVGGPELPATGHLRPGDRVGRYIIIEEIGAGGMGVVYLGYDTELHRKAALKVLRGRRTGRDTTEGQQRLLREARAMAQLSHPNVVTVYDVGTLDDEVYVAMEFVQGSTLRAWTHEQPRSWVEIVTAFVRTGRGLAAAHATGLVHRDFKPDNVLMGDDERPRVLDFGLAWAPELEDDEFDASASRVEARRLALSSDLTEAGAVVGTPTYMAPEQHLGRRPDHRSDQFSFCAALYETLYRQRPYAARDLDELARAKRKGEIVEPPESAAVPRALFRIVRRGLEPEPDQRFRDMDALLAALRRIRVRTRRRLVAASLLVSCTAAFAWWWSQPASPDGACHAPADKLQEVWNPEHKRAVRSAIEQTALPYAADTARQVDASLEAYAQSWLALGRENCEATLAGDQSADLLDRRTACLRRRLAAMHSLVGVLAEADLEVVRRAVQAVEDLPSLEVCADAESLRKSLPEPEDAETASEVAQLREAMERARAYESSGRIPAARALVQNAVQRARALEYPPVLGEALWSLGRLMVASGETADAQRILEEAYAVSLSAGHDAQAARAAIDLVFLLGYTLARFDHADDWSLHARAMVHRVDPDGELQALLHNVLGATEAARRDFDAARSHFRRALLLEEELLGQRHLSVARTLHNLGSMESELGDIETARPLLERALELRTESLGRHHPQVGSMHMVLGATHFFEGDFDQTHRHYQEALRIAEQSGGRNHPSTAEHGVTAGFAYLGLGRPDLAAPLAQRAVTVFEARSRSTPELARALHLMGDIATDEGRWEDAKQHYRDALEVRELTLGPEHPTVATLWFRLGMAHVHDNEIGEARDALGRAEQIIEAKYGTEHHAAADLLQGTAELHALLGDDEEALAAYERALELFASATHPSLVATGDIRFAMANLLAKRTDRLENATAQATAARRDYERAGPRGRTGLERLDAWEAARDQP
jgi:eukaryotic-like serine/threonine-protein kinase